MSYKELTQLCKNIGDINISNTAGNYRAKYEMDSGEFIVPTIRVKNNKIDYILVINSYISFNTRSIFKIEIILNDNDVKIIHDLKETNLNYDILNEDYDDTYFILKLGRYELDFEYKILYSVYLDLCKRGSKL